MTYLRWLFAFLWLVVGFVIALLVTYRTDVKVESTLMLSHLLSIIITISVALFIGYLLKKRADDRRVEKDQLIKILHGIENELIALRALAKSLSQTSEDKTEFYKASRDLSNSLSSLSRWLEVYEYDKLLKSQYLDANKAYMEYRTTLGDQLGSSEESAKYYVGTDREVKLFDRCRLGLNKMLRDINRL